MIWLKFSDVQASTLKRHILGYVQWETSIHIPCSNLFYTAGVNNGLMTKISPFGPAKSWRRS